MNKLSVQARVQILNCLSEGMGINGTARVTGASKNTVLKLLAEVGEACALYQDRVMRNLKCERIEMDEIWSFIGTKQRNVRDDHPEEYGDCYTFTAIDPDSKLMPCWLVGVRNRECTSEFIADLASRVTGRVQLTTDAWTHYRVAIEREFGGRADYAVLDKDYSMPAPAKEASRRYSPNKITKVTKAVVSGSPDPAHISTSMVERANLSMRMGMRRFTRLTNAFSRKLENHMHAVSFYFMVYNFVRIHKSLKTTPAMQAAVTDFLWSMEDIVMMADTNG